MPDNIVSNSDSIQSIILSAKSTVQTDLLASCNFTIGKPHIIAFLFQLNLETLYEIFFPITFYLLL